ncbi:MAG TPA: cytochrome D1 domain-containing protein [Thermodesulfovibrionales bacterium]|nr:cytochrome D1 domain-containing protein [Thermodesulfovibrionales bacterium]
MRRTAISFAALLLTVFISSMVHASERVAFVSSEGENNVTVIDLNTEKVIKTLPAGTVPHAMAATPAGRVYVNNRGSKDLTVIQADGWTVAKTIAIPATSFQLAVSPDGKTLAVAYKDALKLSLIDTATDAITKTVELGKVEGEFKAPMVKHPYWSPDGKFVYAPDSVNGTIVKVNVSQGSIEKVITLPGTSHYLHPSPDGKVLYSVNEKTKGGTSLTLIDAGTDTIIKDIPFPLAEGEKGLGHHGAFSPDNRYFFFCNEGGSHVAVLDTAKREWVKTIKTGKGPGHPSLSRDGKYFFIVHHNDGVISVIDIAQQENLKDIRIGNGTKQAHASYFTPDGKFFYAVASDDKILAKIDVGKMEVISTIPVPSKAMFFGIREGNTFPSTE